MAQLFANNGASVLDGAISAAQTTFNVVDASTYPVLSQGDFFLLTLTNAGYETQWEVIKVTSVSGNTLTCERGIEGTIPLSWPDRAKAEIRLTAQTLTDAMNKTELTALGEDMRQLKVLVLLSL